MGYIFHIVYNFVFLTFCCVLHTDVEHEQFGGNKCCNNMIYIMTSLYTNLKVDQLRKPIYWNEFLRYICYNKQSNILTILRITNDIIFTTEDYLREYLY